MSVDLPGVELSWTFLLSFLRNSGTLEELSAVLGREFFGLGRQRLLGSLVQLRRRRGPRRDRDADLHKEVLLAGGRTDTQQPYGLARTVMKLVRSVRGDIYRITRTKNGFVATERYVKFAFENDECLLEVVPVRRRPAARRNVHVDETKATVGVLTSEQDRVCITRNPDMRQTLI